mmetsp:Transcript_43563/g.60486  ORF Transcript_43563/g.60486 Transcript_43563/m.60486 type:complete len:236 (-) Transcript_43563:1045-1752(-)
MTTTSDSSEFATTDASNLLFKFFEILVMLLYTVDLLPKIFVWKKPLWWKAINICIVTVMVLQVPLTMYVYTESGISKDILKIRTLSLSISFMIVLEIFSIREQRTIRTSRRFAVRKGSISGNDESINSAVEAVDPEKKFFSWAEIIKHDKPGDCWVVIHGKVYDVTDFVNVHPGGPMIYDGAGGDCTPMWESYHTLGMLKQGPPKKYMIGSVRNYEDFYNWDGKFFYTLKEKVEA